MLTANNHQQQPGPQLSHQQQQTAAGHKTTKWNVALDERLAELVVSLGPQWPALQAHHFPGFTAEALRQRWMVIENAVTMAKQGTGVREVIAALHTPGGMAKLTREAKNEALKRMRIEFGISIPNRKQQQQQQDHTKKLEQDDNFKANSEVEEDDDEAHLPEDKIGRSSNTATTTTSASATATMPPHVVVTRPFATKQQQQQQQFTPSPLQQQTQQQVLVARGVAVKNNKNSSGAVISSSPLPLVLAATSASSTGTTTATTTTHKKNTANNVQPDDPLEFRFVPTAATMYRQPVDVASSGSSSSSGFAAWVAPSAGIASPRVQRPPPQQQQQQAQVQPAPVTTTARDSSAESRNSNHSSPAAADPLAQQQKQQPRQQQPVVATVADQRKFFAQQQQRIRQRRQQMQMQQQQQHPTQQQQQQNDDSDSPVPLNNNNSRRRYREHHTDITCGERRISNNNNHNVSDDCDDLDGFPLHRPQSSALLPESLRDHRPHAMAAHGECRQGWLNNNHHETNSVHSDSFDSGSLSDEQLQQQQQHHVSSSSRRAPLLMTPPGTASWASVAEPTYLSVAAVKRLEWEQQQQQQHHHHRHFQRHHHQPQQQQHDHPYNEIHASSLRPETTDAHYGYCDDNSSHLSGVDANGRMVALPHPHDHHAAFHKEDLSFDVVQQQHENNNNNDQEQGEEPLSPLIEVTKQVWHESQQQQRAESTAAATSSTTAAKPPTTFHGRAVSAELVAPARNAYNQRIMDLHHHHTGSTSEPIIRRNNSNSSNSNANARNHSPETHRHGIPLKYLQQNELSPEEERRREIELLDSAALLFPARGTRSFPHPIDNSRRLFSDGTFPDDNEDDERRRGGRGQHTAAAVLPPSHTASIGLLLSNRLNSFLASRVERRRRFGKTSALLGDDDDDHHHHVDYDVGVIDGETELLRNNDPRFVQRQQPPQKFVDAPSVLHNRARAVSSFLSSLIPKPKAPADYFFPSYNSPFSSASAATAASYYYNGYAAGVSTVEEEQASFYSSWPAPTAMAAAAARKQQQQHHHHHHQLFPQVASPPTSPPSLLAAATAASGALSTKQHPHHTLAAATTNANNSSSSNNNNYFSFDEQTGQVEVLQPSRPYDLCSSVDGNLSPQQVVMNRLWKKQQQQSQHGTDISKHDTYNSAAAALDTFRAHSSSSSSSKNGCCNLNELLDSRPVHTTLDTLDTTQKMCPILCLRGLWGSLVERLLCPDPAEVMPFVS